MVSSWAKSGVRSDTKKRGKIGIKTGVKFRAKIGLFKIIKTTKKMKANFTFFSP